MLDSKKSFAVLCALFCSIKFSHAAELASTNLTFKSNLTQRSCELTDESQSFVVDLKTWSTRDLYKIGDKTQSIPFAIQFKNCVAQHISVTFMGQGDTSDVTLLALDKNSDASNVAIEILDHESQRIDLTVPKKYDNDNNPNLRLNFAARYISTGNTVIAGTANATANFVVEYD